MIRFDQRCGFIREGVFLFAAACAAGYLAEQAAAVNTVPAVDRCEVSAATHEGLPAVRMTNHWVELILVPKLGGRLMQVRFAGHAYLFENR
ncbi:MAG: hypothetical protein WA785_09380, partial [Candidatus Acidiferrales bacterium]